MSTYKLRIGISDSKGKEFNLINAESINSFKNLDDAFDRAKRISDLLPKGSITKIILNDYTEQFCGQIVST